MLELLDISKLVGLQPGDSLVDGSGDGGLVLLGDDTRDLLVTEGGAEGVGVVLQTVLGLDLLGGFVILSLELLGVLDHTVDIGLGETSLVVGDGDLVDLVGALVLGRDVQDTVGINIEGNLNLGNTTGSGGDTSQIELAEQVVVLGELTLTLEDLDGDSWLVIGVGGEGVGGLGGDGGVTVDEVGHDTASGLNTERQGGDIQQQEVGQTTLGDTSQNGGLDGSTVGDGLIRVDGLAQLLTVEEVLEERLDLGDTSGTTDQDNIVDGGLVHLGVTDDLLDGVKSTAEEVLVELLETGTGHGGVEIDTLEERVDLDGGLGLRRQGPLGTLASSSQTTHGTSVGGHVLLVLPLELSGEVVDHSVIEILTTQVSITSGGLDLEDTVLNGQQGDIESSSSQIEDEDVPLLSLLVQTVSDGSGGGLVNDTTDGQTGDDTSVLGGLTLRIVEVSGDGNDSLLDGLANEGLRDLPHLDEDHGRDLLRGEGLLLSLVLDLEGGLGGSTIDDLEGPVLHVRLDSSLIKTTTDQTLGVEDGVIGVHGDLILGGITNQTLRVGESDIRGGGTVTLVVGNDLNAIVLPVPNARVGGTQINTNDRSLVSHCDVCERTEKDELKEDLVGCRKGPYHGLPFRVFSQNEIRGKSPGFKIFCQELIQKVVLR